MFLDYYGLKDQPFGATPDPSYLYRNPAREEAFAALVYGIETGRGFMALVGPPGTGKTTLLFQLLDRLQDSARTAFVFQTQCNSRELFRYLLGDLEVPIDDQNLAQMHEQLNQVLIAQAQAGRRFVLIIDEAQDLEESVLETVRLLSNFETTRDKLLQIILAGQPRLAEKLASPGLLQLRQRISVLSRLRALTSAETSEYIEHRLRVAGYQGPQLFTTEALALISSFSRGIPRDINNLCFNALSLACALEKEVISPAVMQEVINDLSLGPSISVAHDAHRRVSSSAPAPVTPLAEHSIVDSTAIESQEGPITPRTLSLPSPPGDTPSQPSGGLIETTLIGQPQFSMPTPPSTLTRYLLGILLVLALLGILAARSWYSPPPQARGADMATTSQAEAPTKAPPQNTIEPIPIGTPSWVAAASAAGDQPNLAPRLEKPSVPPEPAPEAEGGVDVTSNVAGAQIVVDGKAKRGWMTPYTLILAPGIHLISLMHPGYNTASQEFSIRAGSNREIHIRLTPAVRSEPPHGAGDAEIDIITDPPGLETMIDGKSVGVSPIQFFTRAGSHTCQVIPPPGKGAWERTCTVARGEILHKKLKW